MRNGKQEEITTQHGTQNQKTRK